MRIFLAGATGAVGVPIVARLRADGHEVFGLTRAPERARHIEQLGATAVIADILDAADIAKAVKKVEPEVVIDMLTSLPKSYTPKEMKKAAQMDKKVRVAGGAHLQKAAIEAKAKRYMIQSAAFWYAPGLGLATEETPFIIDGPPGISEGVKTYKEIEKRVLESQEIEGVALRFGFFYGPGTWFAPEGNMADQVRKGEYAIAGGGSGHWNFVHVEDAADGVAKALAAPAGAYNITNDTPVALSVWLPGYAKWLKAPAPPVRTAEQEEKLHGEVRVYYATQLRGASNAKAKWKLGFHPRHLEWL